jgi:hypothetical protein
VQAALLTAGANVPAGVPVAGRMGGRRFRMARTDRTGQIADAPDGRRLTFAEWGDLSGSPLFAWHGTPGCRLNRYPNEELARSAGARMITYDRAGYGGSDRHRGRTVADDASDIA